MEAQRGKSGNTSVVQHQLHQVAGLHCDNYGPTPDEASRAQQCPSAMARA